MSKSKKIIKQWIIQSSSLEDFEYEIDLNLSIGWEILEGSYSVIQNENETVYSQVLVWRDKLSKDVFFDFYDEYYSDKKHGGKKRVEVDQITISNIKNNKKQRIDEYKSICYYRYNFDDIYTKSVRIFLKILDKEKNIHTYKNKSLRITKGHDTLQSVEFNNNGEKDGKFSLRGSVNKKQIIGEFRDGIPIGEWKYSDSGKSFDNPGVDFVGQPIVEKLVLNWSTPHTNEFFHNMGCLLTVNATRSKDIFAQGSNKYIFYENSLPLQEIRNWVGSDRHEQFIRSPIGYFSFISMKDINEKIFISSGCFEILNRNSEIKIIGRFFNRQELELWGFDDYSFKLSELFIYYDSGGIKEKIKFDELYRLVDYEYFYKNGQLFGEIHCIWEYPKNKVALNIGLYMAKRFYPNGQINRYLEWDNNGVINQKLYSPKGKLYYEKNANHEYGEKERYPNDDGSYYIFKGQDWPSIFDTNLLLRYIKIFYPDDVEIFNDYVKELGGIYFDDYDSYRHELSLSA